MAHCGAVDLPAEGINDALAITIAEMLPHAPQLRRVDLSKNREGLTIESAQAFARSIRQGVMLTELLLGSPRSENEYPEQVAAALVEALQINPVVEKVAPHELA